MPDKLRVYDELERALDTEAQIIGVNNRNLKTFEVSLENTERLSQKLTADIFLVNDGPSPSRSDR